MMMRISLLFQAVVDKALTIVSQGDRLFVSYRGFLAQRVQYNDDFDPNHFLGPSRQFVAGAGL
jgi:hypothetical protein